MMHAVVEPITLKKKVCRPVCRRPSVMTERGDPWLLHLTHISSVREIPSHSSESEQTRILLERPREQILADCQAEIRKHEFQADYDRRSIQKLNEMIESQQEELDHALAADERLRQDHQLLHEQLLQQNCDLREAHEKSLTRRKLVEDLDTILEFIGKIQELQNEINCIIRFERFSRCSISTQWTFPRYQSTSVFPTSSSSWWNAKPFSGNGEPQKWTAKNLDTWFFGKRFCKSNSVFFRSLSAGVESMEF